MNALRPERLAVWGPKLLLGKGQLSDQSNTELGHRQRIHDGDDPSAGEVKLAVAGPLASK
jgi:hypothetical protein